MTDQTIPAPSVSYFVPNMHGQLVEVDPHGWPLDPSEAPPLPVEHEDDRRDQAPGDGIVLTMVKVRR